RVRTITTDRRLQDQNASRELVCRRQGLGYGFRLAHHTNVVFQGKNLAQTGAEDRLRVSHDHTDEPAVAVRFAFTRLPEVAFHGDRNACHQFSWSAQWRSNRYSSMTTPTPRRPSSSKLRTTRPRQSSCTSDVAPTTSAGSEMVKSNS